MLLLPARLHMTVSERQLCNHGAESSTVRELWGGGDIVAVLIPELLTRWLVRARKGADITIQGHKMEGSGIDITRRWQKEFEDEFCEFCVHFDAVNRRFKEKQHQNDPEDCSHHWTDVVGVCWNFRERETGKNIRECLSVWLGTTGWSAGP